MAAAVQAMPSPDSPPPYQQEPQPTGGNWPLSPAAVPARKPVPTSINVDGKMQEASVALPVQINLPPTVDPHQPSSAIIETMAEVRLNDGPLPEQQPIVAARRTLPPSPLDSPSISPVSPISEQHDIPPPPPVHRRNPSYNSANAEQPSELQPQLQYHHQPYHPSSPLAQATARSSISDSPSSSNSAEAAASPPANNHLMPHSHGASRTSLARPSSAYSSLSDLSRDRNSPNHLRAISAQAGRTPDGRPLSYANLLNETYPQQAPNTANFTNRHLKVGANAALLSHKKTLDMYRMNAKKTNDPTTQYELAVFMINMAKSMDPAAQVDGGANGASKTELIKEARDILRGLSDRGYPFAQYYLADGYASGLFHPKGKEDWDRAVPLFTSAAKHGHAESAYRAALCNEFGWGCRRDPAKAVEYYRYGSSKGHPGAMTRFGKACLLSDFGLEGKHREGLRWLRRATEKADEQYNSAPYELGLLHELGYYDFIFCDQAYTAQLYTQAADLGHPEAAFRMGEAYEHGKLTCPKDAGLSIHFYTEAAQRGHAPAQMALCAWYLVGAGPVLEKNENEAYEWALKAAGLGLPKAQYAIGYFTETGIGCRADALEANVWYVRAADQGDERAMNRIATIQAAASGEKVPANPSKSRFRKGQNTVETPTSGQRKISPTRKGSPTGNDKDCIIM